MRRHCQGLITVGLLLLTAGGIWAEDPGEKAARYHKLLLKRPDNETIYERFLDAWLDEGTKEGLEEFLGEEAKEGGVRELWILAIYHQQGGRDEEALKALDRAVEMDGKQAGLRLARAKVKGRLLQFEEALEDLEQVPRGDSEAVIEALKLKGGFLARAGRPEEGVQTWKDLLEANPGDEELVEDLIELEIGEGLYEEALEAAMRLAAETKDAYQQALRRLRVGEMQKLHGSSQEAVKTYSLVLDSTGQGTWLEREVLAQIDDLFRRDDDFEGLRAFYEMTATAQPQRVQLKKALAHMTAEVGELDDAVRMMRELMKLSPGDRALRDDLVELLAQFDREEEAAEELERLLEADPKNVVRWERLAELRSKAGNKAGLKAALEKVDALAGAGEEARLRVARVYERFGLKEDAEKVLRAAAEGDSWEAQEALASFLMDAGQEAAALAQWKEMAAGGTVEGLMRVVRSLQARGKIEEGYQMMMARRADFGRDPVSLAMFCQIAQMADHAVEALEEALRLVALADQPTEIHDAVNTAARLIMRAGKEEDILGSLGEKASVNDLCLGAELLELAGDSGGADAMLQRAADAGGGLLATTQKVRILEQRGEFAEAVEAMRGIVESAGGRRLVYRKRLVGLLRRAGNLAGALVEIERWKQATPGDQLAWLAQASVHAAAGEHEKAVTVLRRAQARFGKEEEIRVQLANAYLEVGDSKAAQDVFEKLYEDADQSGDKVRWAARLAKVADEAGTAEELIRAFERRKRNNPTSILPLLALAEIHHVLNRYDDRRAALQEAIRRRPKDLSLRLKLARVEERAGDLERAVESLKAARKHDRTGATQRHLARLLFRYGDFEDALAILRESNDRKIDPRDAEDMAEVMVQEKEWEAASNYLAPIVVFHPNDYRLRYVLALCAEESGDRERAVEFFLELTNARAREGAPLPGVTPIISMKTRDHWNRIANAVLPRRALNLNLVFFYLQHAYSYRGSAQYRVGSPGINRSLPGDAQEAWALSICQLMNMARAMEGREREEFMARLDDSGIKDGELLLMATSQGRAQGPLAELLGEMLEKEPEDAALLLLALAGPSHPGKWVDAKWIRAAREKFRKEVPLVALIANQNLLRAGDQKAREEAWKAVPDLLGALEGDHLQFGLVTTAALLNLGSVPDFEVSDEQRKEMFELLMDCFRESKTARPSWSGLETSLMNYATCNDRYEMVVELLNGVCGEPPLRPAATKVRTSQRNSYYHGSLYAQIQARVHRHPSGSIAQMLFSAPPFALPPSYAYGYVPPLPPPPGSLPPPVALIPYPPTSLTSVPSELVRQFRIAPGNVDRRWIAFVKRHASQVGLIDHAKLVKRLDAVSNQALRLLILANADDPEAMAREVEMAAAREGANYDELLFAASYYAREDGSKLKAMKLLAKLRTRPLSKEQMGVVDRYLLLLGAELHERKELPEELIKVAKLAGSRVRRQPTMAIPRSRHYPIVLQGSRVARQNPAGKMSAALAQLGVAAVNPRIVRPHPPPTLRSPRGTRTNRFEEEVGKLMQRGNRKAAIRRAAREMGRVQMGATGPLPMSRAFTSVFAIGKSSRWSSGAGLSVAKVVEGLGLTEDVLAQLDPGAGGGELRQMRFASICVMFKKSGRAQAAYKRALASNPESASAKAKLIALMTPEERREMLRELELGEEAMEILSYLYGAQKSSTPVFEETLEMVQTLTLLLEMTKPDGKASRNFSLVNHRAVDLIRTYSFRDVVEVRRLAEKKAKGVKDSKLTVELHGAFYDLCIAMLRHPQTAAQGFMLLHFGSEARGEDLFELENEAILAIRAMVKLEQGPQGPIATSNRWNLRASMLLSGSGGLPSSVPAPAEYLLWLAGKEDRPNLLAEDFLETIERTAPILAERMRSYREVLFSKGEERLKAFAGLQESFGEGSGIHSLQDLQIGIRFLMNEVSDDREFIDALGESILDFKLNQRGQIANVGILTVLPFYGQKLLELQGLESYQEFLVKISTALLGEREEWDLVDQAYTMGLPLIRNRANSHRQLMESLLRQVQTAMPTAMYLSRNGLDRFGSRNVKSYLHSAMRWVKMQDEGALERSFKEGGFLTGAAEFDPLSHGSDPLNHRKTPLTILEMLCAPLRSTNAGTNVLEIGLEWMKAEGEDRFGKRLIGVAMQSSSGDHIEVIATELIANRKVIEAMPIKQQIGLARFLSRWFGPDLRKIGFPEELEEWREALGAGEREQAQQQIAELLKNGFGSRGESNARQAMKTAVLSSMKGDETLAAKLVGRYVQDFLAQKTTGRYQGLTFSSGWPVGPWDLGLRELSYRKSNGEYSLRSLVLFVAALLEQPEGNVLNFESDLLRSLGSALRKSLAEIDKRPEVIALKEDADEKRIAAYWKIVAESLMAGVPAESEGVVAMGLASYLFTYWSVSEEEYSAVVAAANELSKTHPRIAMAIGTAARVRRPSPGEEARGEARESLAEFLQDEGMPNELRYEFLAVLTSSQKGGALIAEKVGEAMLAVLCKHCNGERNVLTPKFAGLVERVSDPGLSARVEEFRALLLKLMTARRRVMAGMGWAGNGQFDRALVLLALRAEDDAVLDELLGGGKKSQVRGDTELLRSLMRAGKAAHVQKVLPAPGENFRKTSRVFDKEIEELLGTFLPTMASETSRYQIECFMAGLPDAQGDAAPVEDRSARLERLVGDYVRKAPKDSHERLKLLDLFAATERAPKGFLDELNREASKVTLAHNIILKNTSFTGNDTMSRAANLHRSNLVRHVVRLELQAGQVELAIKQIKALGSVMTIDRSASEANKILKILLPQVVRGLVVGALDPAVEKEVYLPLIQTLAELGLDQRVQSGAFAQEVVALGVVIHALAGAGAEFDKMVEELPADRKEMYEETRKTVGLRSIFKFWASQLNTDADQDGKARRKILRAILVDPATCNREIAKMSELSSLLDSNAFERADLLAVIDSLPVDHPRRAEFILEKAEVLGRSGVEEGEVGEGEVEEGEGDPLVVRENQRLAQSSYALAIKLAREVGKDALLSRGNLYLAQFTNEVLRDPAKAHEIAEEVKPDLLVEGDRKIYDRESPIWKEAAANK